MGTTLDQLERGRIEAGWVLAIDGYDVLLTNRSDLAGAIAAWSGTDWTQAAGGLKVTGEREQSITPFAVDWEQGGLSFEIVGDEFGTAAHDRLGGSELEIVDTVNPADTSFEVRGDGSKFTSPGTVWLDHEVIDYTSINASGVFSGLTRGRFSAYETSTGEPYRRAHTVYSVRAPKDLAIAPLASSQSRDWVGRWVALYLHRIEGGVWDSRDEAQLVFSGRITDIRDTEELTTVVDCQDVKSVLQDATVFRDQWRANVGVGLFITRSTEFVRCTEESSDPSGGPGFISQGSEPLQVTQPGGATSATVIEEGFYTYEEIANFLNIFFNDQYQKGAGFSNGLRGRWEAGTVQVGDEGSQRIEIKVVFDGSESLTHFANAEVRCRFRDSQKLVGIVDVDQKEIPGWLGFKNWNKVDRFRQINFLVITDANADGDGRIIAEEPPREISVTQLGSDWGKGYQLGYESAEGTFIDQLDYLPSSLKARATRINQARQDAGFDPWQWGLFDANGQLIFAAFEDGTSFLQQATATPDLRRLFGQGDLGTADAFDIKLGDDGTAQIKQVLALDGRFSDLVLRFFASSGSAGWNEPTYDEFPASLSVAMPWSILGDRFRQSLEALDEHYPANVTLFIRESLPLSELLAPDLILRNAHLIWRGGNLEFTTWASENSVSPTFVLGEDTKASSVATDKQLSPSSRTDEFLRNIFVFMHTPDIAGNFREIEEFRFSKSISRYGERRIEVKLTSTFSDTRPIAGEAAEDAIAWFMASVAPFFANPLSIVERTYRMGFFERLAPGDLVLLTDDYIRGAIDGKRGVESRPALVLGTRYWYGGSGSELFGTLQILFNDDEPVGSWSPAAEVDDTENSGNFSEGYDSTTRTFRTQANVYSQDDVDAASFEVGDAIDVVEVDPNDPGVAEVFSTTVVSVSGQDIQHAAPTLTLTAGNKYRIVSSAYGSATDTQREDVYQALEETQEIQTSPTVNAQVYAADFRLEDVAPADSTTLIERYSDQMYGQGQPMSASVGRHLAIMVNNLIDYRAAVSGPFMCTDILANVVADYQLRLVKPIYLGIGRQIEDRFLYVAPLFASDGGIGRCRVTLSRFMPTGTRTDFRETTFLEPFQQVEFSTLSTTLAVPAEQGLNVAEVETRGIAFLSIELNNAQAWGLAVLRLGPRE